MPQVVVSVKDRAMDAYARPFFVPTTQMALRSFADEVNRQAEDNPMNKHPKDYELYQLGTFDDETGRFENLEQPQRIARAEDVIKENKE